MSHQCIFCHKDFETSHICPDCRGKSNNAMLDAASEMYWALVSALEWVEADEAVHGRTFGTGEIIRQALKRAKGEK